MFFFIISILPFVILCSKQLPIKPLPSWASEVRLLSVLFFQEFLYSLSHSLNSFTFKSSFSMACKRKCVAQDVNVEGRNDVSVLDLPDLAIDCILSKLAPNELCNMACVCSSMREKCRSDYFWERHMREKWGRIVGKSARKEWESYLSSRKNCSSDSVEYNAVKKKWIGALSSLWPLSWLKSRLSYCNQSTQASLIDDSIMSWYLSLETGRFWFPAQVYNREHGHVGFMLSCYDAELSYDSRTNTFQARYPPHGKRTVVIEEGVQWERVRAPPMDTPAHTLHLCDCLHDLRPGDHIEIQWRRNKEFPYGWWYGVVGHLESCDGSEHFCRCHQSETVVLEFNQYTPGSRWRRCNISRKDHKEEGDEAGGFYGGIRKLYTKDEISTWKNLWPVEVLE